MSKIPVSVVVPAFNCEKTISETIKAVLSQTYPFLELIVVDDGSKDKTADMVKSSPQVKYFYQENAGPASARNRGAFEAKGEVVFFTDSDCIPHLDWIEKAIVHFGDPGTAVVAGSYDIANPESILARCIHKEIIYRHHRLMPENPKSFGSYNFGVRKKVFLELGGFDTSYRFASGEDNDLSYKINKAGYKIYFAKEVLVKHFHPVELKRYLFEQYRHGVWRAKMYKDHPSMAKGDDYTFWKDIAEIPLVYIGILDLLSGSVLNSRAFEVLFALELIFGFIMVKNFKDAVFYALVMFLRAGARAIGFILGLILVFKNYIKNK